MAELHQNCIFCKIVKKEIPCHQVFEDKKFLVFLDIKPVNHGHLLVIPKKHITWMQEADDKIIGDIYKLSKKMMLSLKKSLKCDYVHLSVMGNEVPHFHIHLIPRYNKDSVIAYSTKKYEKNEDSRILKKIQSALSA